MDKEKFDILMANEEFVKKIVAMQTPEEVQAAFKEEGVEISTEEIGVLGTLINEYIKKEEEPLDEQDLENIAGGGEGDIEDKIRKSSEMSTLGALSAVTLVPAFMGVAFGTALGATTVGVAWAIDKYKTNKKMKKLKEELKKPADNQFTNTQISKPIS